MKYPLIVFHAIEGNSLLRFHLLLVTSLLIIIIPFVVLSLSLLLLYFLYTKSSTKICIFDPRKFTEELEQERNEREKIESQVKVLQEELNEAKSQVTITEFTKDNEIEDLKQRGQQEIATLHKLYEGFYIIYIHGIIHF
jgi:Skp family chaperone for outer membrane proteins